MPVSSAHERLYTNRLAALPGVSKARSQIGMKTIRQGSTLPITGASDLSGVRG
jgi:hypothetical protein